MQLAKGEGNFKYFQVKYINNPEKMNRIGGKEIWTWRRLGPACSLQALVQPSYIEVLNVKHLCLPSFLIGFWRLPGDKEREGF